MKETHTMTPDLAVTQQREGAVLELTLNAPPLNPIGVAQVAALEELVTTVAEDKSIRCVVLRGRGEHFSVGANLKEAEAALEAGPKAFVKQRVELFNRIEALEKPVVAAIRGYCLGGGLELAMSCHFRVADDTAQLSLPEINLGAAPLWSGASRMLRLIGRARALEMLLRGHRINAATAHHIGLVHEVHSRADLDTAVAHLAAELAEKPPLAVASVIRVINRSQDLDLGAGLDYELDVFSRIAGTKDNIEGVMAMFEKRKPHFVGE